MTRRLTNLLLVFGTCILVSGTAFGQIRNAELNVFVAQSFYTRNHYVIGAPQSSTPIPGEVRFDNQTRYGARFGVYTRGHWGQEFFYSFEPNTITLSEGGANPTSLDLRVRMHNYGINALFYTAEAESHLVLPFLSAGLGGTAYQIRQESLVAARDPNRGNAPDINNSHELAFNFGAGLKVRSGWFGLRLDARDFLSRTPSFGLVRQSVDPSATVLPATGVTHNAEVSLGLNFYFGQR